MALFSHVYSYYKEQRHAKKKLRTVLSPSVSEMEKCPSVWWVYFQTLCPSGLKREKDRPDCIQRKDQSQHLWWYGDVLVTVAWITGTSVMLGNSICCYPDDIVLRVSLIIPAGLCQATFCVASGKNSAGTRLACLQSRPFQKSYIKHEFHFPYFPYFINLWSLYPK